jgi:hypothetical protein
VFDTARPTDGAGVPLAQATLTTELARSYELASYFPASVRRVRAATDSSTYVLVAFARAEPAPSAECVKLLKRSHPGVARSQGVRGDIPLYCFVDAHASAERDLGCARLDEVEASPRVFAASFVFHAPVLDLVPRGVAAVRVEFPEHAPIVAEVRAGTFLLRVPSAPPPRLRRTFARLEPLVTAGADAPGAKASARWRRAVAEWNRAVALTRPIRVEWLSRSGSVLRTIGPPSSPPPEVVGRTPLTGG